VQLLKDYYHVESVDKLSRSILEDVFVSLILRSGSGLFSSVIKGLVSKFFIKSGYPVLIGRRSRIVHPSNMLFGHHIWLKDDVSVTANGPLEIGNDFVAGEGTALWSDKKGLCIGDDVGLGKHCYIAQLGGRIIIGSHVLIADSVRMYSLSHRFENINTNIINQGYKETTITIEDNVWIGSGVVVYNNCNIGTGSVIGAHTVVNKNVPPYVVFAGNPGKIIKKLRK
jgi:acetyltransferase-like isoleucine patch superfamily enzyme